MNSVTVTCLISAILCLVFALTIFTLRRSARILQEKSWANPFGLTFFVLAGMYALRFCALVLEHPLPAKIFDPLDWTIKAVTLTASGVTTYFIMLAAFRLGEPSLPQRGTFRKILVDYGYLTLLILCFVGMLQIVPDVWPNLNKWLRISVLLPDNAFSAVALLSMGFVLFRNIRFRQDKPMARLVLWSSAAYALLFLILVANDIIGWMSNDSGKTLFMFTVALLLKLGLFFPAFSLLLLESAPLVGIEKLLENITRKNKEYLESEGIVKSICEELHLDRVDLYVRLPGEKEKLIARFSYPKVGDEDPQVFEYQRGTDYDRVFKTEESEIVNRDDYSYTFLHRISTVSVPILFHNAVIACLKVQAGEEKFTEIDLNNLKRIAIMISPAVQTYRETFALNKLSHDLSALQIKVKKFDLETDIRDICERIHNVTSSTIVGVSIEAGFCEYHGVFPPHESLEASVNKLFHADLESEDFKNTDGSCRWFVKELKITPPPELAGEQVFGRFIFGVADTQHPPIGTSPVCHQALTGLINDTMLDFIRGHLNQVTDKLGEKLSGLRGTELKDWHAAVEAMAQMAKLTWVVVVSRFDRGNERLGHETALQLIDNIELPECKDTWITTESGFSLYRPAEADVSYVIKKRLIQSGDTIWFGVAHSKFGPELNFISPWAYFLDHFCAIADSSLKLLKDRKQHQLSIASTFGMAIGVHRLVNLARSVHSVYVRLNSGLDRGTIQCSENDKTLIRSSQELHDQLDEMLQTLFDVKKRDERVGISIDEVLKSVSTVVNGQLSEYDIKFEILDVPPESRQTLVGLPVYVAVNALVVAIENSRDALRFASRNGHKREITIHIDGSADQDLICSVVDNGPGVPAEIVPKLFIEPCRTSKPNSNGFGLFCTSNLLWAFDGNISYHRERRGDKEYTVFRITLPRSQTKP